jgi:hypothetical protein
VKSTVTPRQPAKPVRTRRRRPGALTERGGVLVRRTAAKPPAMARTIAAAGDAPPPTWHPPSSVIPAGTGSFEGARVDARVCGLRTRAVLAHEAPRHRPSRAALRPRRRRSSGPRRRSARARRGGPPDPSRRSPCPSHRDRAPTGSRRRRESRHDGAPWEVSTKPAPPPSAPAPAQPAAPRPPSTSVGTMAAPGTCSAIRPPAATSADGDLAEATRASAREQERRRRVDGERVGDEHDGATRAAARAHLAGHRAVFTARVEGAEQRHLGGFEHDVPRRRGPPRVPRRARDVGCAACAAEGRRGAVRRASGRTERAVGREAKAPPRRGTRLRRPRRSPRPRAVRRWRALRRLPPRRRVRGNPPRLPRARRPLRFTTRLARMCR